MFTVQKRKAKNSEELLYSVDVPTVVETSPVEGAVEAYVEAVVAAGDGVGTKVLVGVPFASPAAEKAAKAAGLGAWDLDRRPRSKREGFTVDEVRELVQELAPKDGAAEPEGAMTPEPTEG